MAIARLMKLLVNIVVKPFIKLLESDDLSHHLPRIKFPDKCEKFVADTIILFFFDEVSSCKRYQDYCR